MLVKMLLGLLCAAVPPAKVFAAEGPVAPLLVVSFDGFRADYLERFPMPNLKLLYSQGVLVEQLTNVFVTKTFPNHYSLMTGLYAESHGIVANNMYDPVTHQSFHVGNGSGAPWWDAAEPLWLTALDSGYKTATAMWPGSDVRIRNRTATHFLNYDFHMTFRERLGNITDWLKDGVTFAVLYWEEPDNSGHKFGPDNDTVMSRVLKEVDDYIGLMMAELKAAGLWGRINVIVTSDHGMTQCSAQRLIRLDDCLPSDSYQLVDLTPVAALIPRIDPDLVLASLQKCHANMAVYLKSSLPTRLHYSNNQRIPLILLVADEGWTIVRRGHVLPRLGDHGFDNSLPSMHPFLAATGPAFHQGYRLASMQSVDVYPLMCRLLAVPPRPNNGSLAQAGCLLADEVCSYLPLMMSLVIGVLLLLLTIAVLIRVMRCRGSQHRWQVDDNEPLLS